MRREKQPPTIQSFFDRTPGFIPRRSCSESPEPLPAPAQSSKCTARNGVVNKGIRQLEKGLRNQVAVCTMTRRMNIAIYLDEKIGARGGVSLVGSALCKLLHSYGHEVTLLNSNQFASWYSSFGLRDEHPDVLPGLKHHLHEDLMSADAILFLSTRHQVPDFLQRLAGGNQSSVRWTVQGVNCIIIGQSSLNLRLAKMMWIMIGQLDVCGMPYIYRPLYQELRDVEESATPSI